MVEGFFGNALSVVGMETVCFDLNHPCGYKYIHTLFHHIVCSSNWFSDSSPARNETYLFFIEKYKFSHGHCGLLTDPGIKLMLQQFINVVGLFE